MENFNIIEVKRLILLSFALFIKINIKKLKQNNILTEMKLSPFPNSFKKLKELFDLIISQISSAGDDFPRFIEISILMH